MKFPNERRQGGGDGKNGGGREEYFFRERFAQAQSGDEKAKCDLCAFVWMVAYRRALSFALPSVYDRQDFAQDVVIKLLEQLPQIRNLKNWLVRVLVGAQSDAYRRHHQKHVILDEFISEQEDDAFETRQLARLEVAQLLEGVEPLERDILYLRHIDNRAFAEIAEMLNMTEGAVRTQFWRTKSNLQKQLGLHSGEAHPHESHSHRTQGIATGAPFGRDDSL